MAIVNEDVRMVKLLLDHGAEVHERCLGSFWLPDDQKAKANVALRKQLTADDLESDRSVDGPGLGTDNLELDHNHFADILTDYNGLVSSTCRLSHVIEMKGSY